MRPSGAVAAVTVVITRIYMKGSVRQEYFKSLLTFANTVPSLISLSSVNAPNRGT